MMRFSVRVVEKSPELRNPWIDCEVQGSNQEGRQILSGRCTLLLPCRKDRH